MSAPVTDADAFGALTTALSKASGVELHVDRSGRLSGLELTHQGSFGADGAHVTVWDADEADDAPGLDYVVTMRRLYRCVIHRDMFVPDDGSLCTLCISELTEGDE